MNTRLPGTPGYASWADHIFNPWLSETRCLNSPIDLVGARQWGKSRGRPESVLDWHSRAALFHIEHKRRPRVFAGPWCWPLDASSRADDKQAFAALIEQTPNIDWFVIATEEQLRNSSRQGNIGLPTHKLWVGTILNAPNTAAQALDSLRRAPAAARFVVANPSCGDPGDLHLESVDWLVISLGLDENAPGADECMAAIKLQCMAYGVPVWFDTPSAYVLRKGSAVPLTTQEEPRRCR